MTTLHRSLRNRCHMAQGKTQTVPQCPEYHKVLQSTMYGTGLAECNIGQQNKPINQRHAHQDHEQANGRAAMCQELWRADFQYILAPEII